MALALAALGGVAVACGAHRRLSRSRLPPLPPPALPIDDDRWPNAAARLVAPHLEFPPGFGVRRVYLDAGHGAANNRGNLSCRCVEEQEFTLDAARELARRLEATGHFEVRLSRDGQRPVEYRDRVDEAIRWGADVFMSLHSDVRGKPQRWAPAPAGRAPAHGPSEPPEEGCPESFAAPGFSVLYSDDGSEDEVARRMRLARAAARRLEEIGLLPYGGADYGALYEPDAAQSGAFLDRHKPEQRIFVLYRPKMPAILIETHHALDPREVERWSEPGTLDAFAGAVAAALVDALAAEAPVMPRD